MSGADLRMTSNLSMVQNVARPELGTLVVVILKADPYALIRLSGTGKTTKVDKKGGQHPVWDEEFRLPVFNQDTLENRQLKVSCYSQETKLDEVIGEGSIDISETLKSGEFDDWVKLEKDGQFKGEVYLEMTFYSNEPPPVRRPSKLAPKDRLWRPSPNNSPHLSPNVSPRPSPNLQPARGGKTPSPHSNPLSLQPGRAPQQQQLASSPPRGSGLAGPVPSILRPRNPRSSPMPLAPGQRPPDELHSDLLDAGPGPSMHNPYTSYTESSSLPNPYASSSPSGPPLPARQAAVGSSSRNTAQAAAFRERDARRVQEEADAAFAASLAEQEDEERRRLEERKRMEDEDLALAKKLAEEEEGPPPEGMHIPGSWT